MDSRGAALQAEHAELAAQEDLFRAAPARVWQDLGLVSEVREGVLLTACRNASHPLLSRALGLGVHSPATLETVEWLTRRFQDEGVRDAYVHVVPDPNPAEVRDWLGALGYVPWIRSWMKFARGATSAPTAESDLEIREIGREHALDFANIVTGGFDIPAACNPMFAAIVEREHWHCYMSFGSDGTPAGTAAYFQAGETAWLSFSSTFEPFRGQGSQSALLARRIQDAIHRGASMLVTETGTFLEGEPQHSYGNIGRAGFEEICLRQNWVLGPTE